VLPESISTEDWEYASYPGKLIRTPSYRLFTTAADPGLVREMPRFLETALERYTSEFGPLPRPSLRLDTFLMGDRDQWASITRQVMGPDAGTYLRIERGGFASGGRAILWTIGRRDTLAIAAHEGWHQFTQRTFKQELPAWLEEGIAVYMEGFVPDPAEPARAIFFGWANVERFEQLQSAAARRTLIPLHELLATTPQDLIAGSTDRTLTYYAQLWALIHFLREGEGGRYSARLNRAIAAAAGGNLLATRLRGEETADVFRAYIDQDVGGADVSYRRFIDRIVGGATPDSIARGESPARPQ
jgi:hypothetical protein